MIPAKTWVQIHVVVLPPEERNFSLPEDTRKVPLELWVKGFLESDAEMGMTVKIRTVTGRILEGELVAQNPSYHHDFGDFVPEILEIDAMVKAALYGSDRDA